MVDDELISRKLSRIQFYVDELRAATDITWEKFSADVRTRAFVERYLHLAIEEIIDTANHIVSFCQWREPAGYRDLMRILSEKGVIPEDQLPIFQNMASFRNMLVHRYEVIDAELVYGIFGKHLADFELFISLITRWVQALPSKDIQ